MDKPTIEISADIYTYWDKDDIKKYVQIVWVLDLVVT